MWLYGDSFDGYATGDLSQRYQLVGANASISPGTGESGTASAKFLNGAGYIGRGVNPADATEISGFHIKWSAFQQRGFFQLWDSINSRGHAHVDTNTNGSISIYTPNDNNGYFGTSLMSPVATSAAGVILPNVLHHVQVKILLHASAGTVEVKVDGATVVSYAGRTANATASGAVYNLVIVGGGSTTYVDNFWVCDGSGATNNDFLGELIGEVGIPVAEGNSSALTPTSGSDNSDMVDDASPDGDTTTVTGSNVGDKDTYTVPALARIGSGIKAVQIVTVAKKSASGTRAIANVTRSGGTDYDSVDNYLSTTYAGVVTVRETDPATSAAWGVAGYEASEIGPKVTV